MIRQDLWPTISTRPWLNRAVLRTSRQCDERAIEPMGTDIASPEQADDSAWLGLRRSALGGGQI